LQIIQLPMIWPRRNCDKNVEEFGLVGWDFSIGLVDEIVQIVRNWNPTMLNITDPSVCYVIFISMIVIHTESKLDTLRKRKFCAEDSRSSWLLLHLFLQQLGSYWPLPNALLSKFDSHLTLDPINCIVLANIKSFTCSCDRKVSRYCCRSNKSIRCIPHLHRLAEAVELSA
jgi:hypothetical protein